jgi:hypothetical protein
MHSFLQSEAMCKQVIIIAGDISPYNSLFAVDASVILARLDLTRSMHYLPSLLESAWRAPENMWDIPGNATDIYICIFQRKLPLIWNMCSMGKDAWVLERDKAQSQMSLMNLSSNSCWEHWRRTHGHSKAPANQRLPKYFRTSMTITVNQLSVC